MWSEGRSLYSAGRFVGEGQPLLNIVRQGVTGSGLNVQRKGSSPFFQFGARAAARPYPSNPASRGKDGVLRVRLISPTTRNREHVLAKANLQNGSLTPFAPDSPSCRSISRGTPLPIERDDESPPFAISMSFRSEIWRSDPSKRPPSARPQNMNLAGRKRNGHDRASANSHLLAKPSLR